MTETNLDPRSKDILDGIDQLLWIDGRPVEATTGEWRDVRNPSLRGEVFARVPAAGTEDVDRAVQAARRAFPEWASLHFTGRAKALRAIGDDIEAEAEKFARLTALDTGNALRTQARPEVSTLVSLFRYFAGAAAESKGVTLPTGDEQLQYTRREPLGVVACILPWNSPLMIAAFKVPAALAAGNTVILKAADDAPLTIQYLAQICQRHLPAGAVNSLTGRGSVIGNALSTHPGVDKVSFTGSTEVGRGVAAQASERLAHLSLELGGKNPSIVFPDAIEDEGILDGLLASTRVHRQGQSCTAGSRLFLHEDIYDEMLEKLAARLDALTVGDPLEETTDIGSVINQSQFDQISGYLAEGRDHPDLTTVLGGEVPTEGPLTEGFYHKPTIFGGARNDFRLAQEEIFGPVLVAIKWKDVDDVIQMANDSHYGLAAYVWTHDLDNALNTAHRLETGWVQVNQGGGQVVGQSYGGYKQSGMGREASLEGMLEGFTQIKQINVKLRG